MKRLIFLALLFLTCPSWANGGVGIVPLQPTDPQSPGWFIYQLDPGESKEDVLIVKNTTQQDWKVVLYPADYLAASGGGFDVRHRWAQMSKVWAWITLSETELLLPAGASKQIPFTIRVPLDAEAGESAGAIMVEKINPNTQAPETEATRSGVILSFRTWARVYNTTSAPVIERLVHEAFETRLVRPIRETSSDWQRSLQQWYENYGSWEVFGWQIYLTDSLLEHVCTWAACGWTELNVFQKIRSESNVSSKVFFSYLVRKAWSGEIVLDSEAGDRYFLISPGSEWETNQRIPQVPLIGAYKIQAKVVFENKRQQRSDMLNQEVSVIYLPLRDILSLALAFFCIAYMFLSLRRAFWKYHVVWAGESWESIALSTNTTLTRLRSMNQRVKFLRPGVRILVPRFRSQHLDTPSNGSKALASKRLNKPVPRTVTRKAKKPIKSKPARKTPIHKSKTSKPKPRPKARKK